MANKVLSIKECRQALFSEHKDIFPNIHMVPDIKRITVNTCCSRFMNDSGKMAQIEQQLRSITCQQPAKTYAKKSNASFKLRQGMHIGYMVTLCRKDAIEAFLTRLIYLNMPRIQDFGGLNSKSFDKCGNFSMGLKDVNAFREVDTDKVTNFGISITIDMSSNVKADNMKLFHKINMPFKEFTA